MAATLSHPDLGKVQGKPGEGVIQYLGIKYASVENRLAPPELIQQYSGTIDGTKLGYVFPMP